MVEISSPGAAPVLRATVTARQSIASSALIQQWLWADALRHCPGVLTGIGIVGTFCGIFQGLTSMSQSLAGLKWAAPAKQVELVTSSVNELFGHVGPAFLASMACVFLALVFTIIEKYICKNVHEQALALARQLDEAFPPIQTDHTLLCIARQSAQSASDMRLALEEVVAGKIEHSLRELLEHQSRHTDLLAAALGQRITEALLPMTGTLTEAVKRIRSDSSTATVDLIREITGEFKQALTSSTGGHMDELAKTLKQSTELMGSQNSSLSDFVDNLRQQMLEQSQMVQNAMRQSREQQAEQRDILGQQLTATLAKVQESLNLMAEESSRKSRQGLESMSETVSEVLGKSLKLQETSDAKIRQAIEDTRSQLTQQIQQFQSSTVQQIDHMAQAVAKVGQDLSSNTHQLLGNLERGTSDSLQSVAKDLNQATQAAVETMAQQVQSSLGSIEAKTSQLLQSTSNSQRELLGELSKFSQNLAQAGQESSTSSLEVARRTQQTVQSLDLMAKNLHELFTKVQGVGGSFDQVGQRMLEASANLRIHSEKAAEQMNHSSGLVSQLHQIEAQLQQQLALHDHRLSLLKEATSGMQGTSQALAKVQEQIGQSLEAFGSGSEKVFGTLRQRHEEHAGAVTEALKTYLSKFDGLMSQSCAGLQSVVEELSGALEDFKDTPRPGQRR